MKIRLNKVQGELNLGLSTIVEFLQKKGFEIKEDPNAVVPEEGYNLLIQEFSADKKARIQSDNFTKERQNKEKPKSVAIEVKEEPAPAPKAEVKPAEKPQEPVKAEVKPAAAETKILRFLKSITFCCSLVHCIFCSHPIQNIFFIYLCWFSFFIAFDFYIKSAYCFVRTIITTRYLSIHKW